MGPASARLNGFAADMMAAYTHYPPPLIRTIRHEQRRPFEIFINSKNLDHYQWIVALTRIMSAVFRKGGDVTFLVDELKAVFDPRGGYWQPDGKFMPSIIAELGHIVEKHLTSIGLLKPAGPDP